MTVSADNFATTKALVTGSRASTSFDVTGGLGGQFPFVPTWQCGGRRLLSTPRAGCIPAAGFSKYRLGGFPDTYAGFTGSGQLTNNAF